MRFRSAVALFVALGWLLSLSQNNNAPDAQAVLDAAYIPVHKFDPARDAAADIQAAFGEAQKTRKRIILDVGGDWCQYCHEMDQLFTEYPELVELREKNYVSVAVYYGSDNKNEQVLSRYPKVEGILHFY